MDLGDQGDLRAQVILGNDGGIIKGLVKARGRPAAGAMAVITPVVPSVPTAAFVIDSDGSYEFRISRRATTSWLPFAMDRISSI